MLKSMRHWGRLPDFEAVVARFPVAVVCMALLTLYFMLDIDLLYRREEGMIFGFILAAYLSVGVQLANESGVRVPVPTVLKTVLAAIAIGLSLFSQSFAFFPIAAILGAIVFLGNFAFMGRSRDDKAVWLFTQKLWTGAIFAFVGSVIFALGVLAIWQTLDVLFGLKNEELMTRFVLPLGLAFLAPVYWLGTLPDPRDPGEGIAELSFEARALAFLGTWLLAPLTLIYGLIITAYALRILVQWELPSNEIARLVTPFIIVGTLTWLMLEPAVLKAGALVRLYRRIWFPLMLAATAMLAVSVGVRVAEYGLTPERVALLSTVIAAFAMAAWFTLTRRRDIRIPTAVAAAFLAAAAFLMKPVADVNQYLRVKSALDAADKTAVAARVHDGVRYLAYKADRREWVQDLLGIEDPDTPDDIEIAFNWEDTLEQRGFIVPERDRQRAVMRDYSNFGYTLDTSIPLDGFDTFEGQYEVHVHGEDVTQYSLPTNRNSFIVGGDWLLSIDGEVVTVRVGDFVGELYDTALSQHSRDSVFDRGRSGEIDRSRVFAFDITLPDGRAGRLTLTELSLNGAGDMLTGGYGKAILVSKR